MADPLALAARDTMTVDAALVTLDFGLRHGLFEPAEAAPLHAGRCSPAQSDAVKRLERRRGTPPGYCGAA